MGGSISRDIEALRTSRALADYSWAWLGKDRQEEMIRIYYAFCVQQSESPAIQKLALAFPFDIFRTRARMLIENFFNPIARTQPNSANYSSSVGVGIDAASPAARIETSSEDPSTISALYKHMGVAFCQMGLSVEDVTLFYDLFLDAMLEIGDEAQAEEIERQRDAAFSSGYGDRFGRHASDGNDWERSNLAGSQQNPTNQLAGFTPVGTQKSDFTPQRPPVRPSSGGGGSIRSKHQARAGGGGGGGYVISLPTSSEPSPNHPNPQGSAPNHNHSSSAFMLSGSNVNIVDANNVSVRLLQNDDIISVCSSPTTASGGGGGGITTGPSPINERFVGRGGAVLPDTQPQTVSQGLGLGLGGARDNRPQRWSVKEQKAWACLLRYVACAWTLEAHHTATSALTILTSNPATGRCPSLRSQTGELMGPECLQLTEYLYPKYFDATSFTARQLRTQDGYAMHTCSNGSQEGVMPPLMERRMRYLTLRHRYLYIYESSAQTNRIRVDEPVVVLDLENTAKEVSTRVEASNGVDRTPLHAVVVTIKSSGIVHTLSFASSIQSGSWQEAFEKSMAFFTTNPFFNSPALPPPPAPEPLTAAQLAAMGSATFADAHLLKSQISAEGQGLGSITRHARFLGMSGAIDSSSSVGKLDANGGDAAKSDEHNNNSCARRFDPHTDVDFLAAFRNSFPFNAKLSDFEFFELLGAGNFGRVVRCRHLYSRHVFALKIIRKERFKGIRNVLEVRRERKVLETADNPYIMKIHRTYQTKTRVYFLLDYLPGGELLRHTNKSPGHRFTEDFSRFVLAELVCACEYMRVNKIIHRDIKGDNLVLDEQGHLILTDFGFAKQLLPGKRHKTCCGTLAYIAPEMLLSNSPEGYDYQVDWWSAGVVLFTVLTGYFPFLKSRRKDTIDAITNQPLQFPQRPAVSEMPMDLCHKLLDKDPKKRYSTLAQIKAHPWFEGFDWAAVESKSLPPPYQSLIHQPAAEKQQDKPADPAPATTPHDEVTLEQELKDAATVMFEIADDVLREEDIFGSFLNAQEDAGSNRDEDSGGSAADSDTDDEWNEGGSDNEEDTHTETTVEAGSTMSGSIVMARPRGYSSSSLIR